ncbi:MAG: lipocalin-like domain-containing protein [Terrimicrobiaceae bacterium]
MAQPVWGNANAGWQLALPGWTYRFPQDHGNHPGFKTEWWYFTGNLRSETGRSFGYQLTFFRQGIRPPGERSGTNSRLLANDIAFAHFAVSDIDENKFYFFQEITRGAFGEASFGLGNNEAIYRIERWSCRRTGLHDFELRAEGPAVSIRLDLHSAKDPVFHGSEGISRKAEGEGRASHYYSLTRLITRGELTLPSGTHRVEGTSWFDHEWATNQLTENQTGWDWFSIHFNDGSELMIFQIRTRDGGRDAHSGGTWIAADGTTIPVSNEEFLLSPISHWKSPASGADYPVHWKLSIPKLALDLKIQAAMPEQELNFPPVIYWEGAIRALGSRADQPVSAAGYLEMTGYGSPIVGMQSPGSESPAPPDNRPSPR